MSSADRDAVLRKDATSERGSPLSKLTGADTEVADDRGEESLSIAAVAIEGPGTEKDADEGSDDDIVGKQADDDVTGDGTEDK